MVGNNVVGTGGTGPGDIKGSDIVRGRREGRGRFGEIGDGAVGN